MHEHTHTHTHARAHTHTHMPIDRMMHVCTCLRAATHTCTWPCVVRMMGIMCICVYVCACVCMHACESECACRVIGMLYASRKGSVSALDMLSINMSWLALGVKLKSGGALNTLYAYSSKQAGKVAEMDGSDGQAGAVLMEDDRTS